MAHPVPRPGSIDLVSGTDPGPLPAGDDLDNDPPRWARYRPVESGRRG